MYRDVSECFTVSKVSLTRVPRWALPTTPPCRGVQAREEERERDLRASPGAAGASASRSKSLGPQGFDRESARASWPFSGKSSWQGAAVLLPAKECSYLSIAIDRRVITSRGYYWIQRVSAASYIIPEALCSVKLVATLRPPPPDEREQKQYVYRAFVTPPYPGHLGTTLSQAPSVSGG